MTKEKGVTNNDQFVDHKAKAKTYYQAKKEKKIARML